METFNNVVLSIKDFLWADWYTCTVNNQNKRDSEKNLHRRKTVCNTG